MLRFFCIKQILQIDLKHFKSVYFTLQAHMATKMCVHTHSLYLWNLLKAFYRLGCPVAQAACQPVTQSAKNLPNLPVAQDCPGPYRPKLLHRDSGFNSLGANTGTHILLSWHSSRMPHSITNFAWSIQQLTAEIHYQFK